MKRKSWAPLIRTVIFFLILTGSGFAVRQFRHTQEASELPLATAHKGEFLVLVRSRGELSARVSEQLTAPLDVTDLQIVWAAPGGSEVKKDQVVIKFDPSRTEQDLKEKNAALQQAQSTLDQAVAQAKITEDQDKLDLATAQYNVEKAKLEASKQTVVSAIQGEESEIDLGLAEEKLKVQQTAMTTHRKGSDQKIAALEHGRDTAKALVKLTEYQLSLMELKSPLNGVINYLPNYSQGWMNAQPFKVGDHAVPGGVLAEIPDLSTLEMESKVDEADRGRIALGDTVLVHVDAFPEKTIAAKLTSITPLTEESFNEWPPTRSFRAFAKLDQPDPRMRPGMNAGADVVETKIPNAISIPAKALFTLNGKPAVYVKTDGQYAPKTVRITAKNPDEVAIEGIDAGTTVALAEPPMEKK
ncbi:MAG TPA: efflux RND transporter periplasmic adaptor subunit [Bryobacteraceae bacterium]|jgi:multidrug efflux pump subunit AcrA (membrane-fusion protein)|nr:efflux RND transporter periplasmic adaptor subunit [Bryobacteraceae bacterium]